MAHPLGEVALLVPHRDAATAENLGRFEAALAGRDVATRRVPLPADVEPVVRGLVDAGTRLLVHCGGQRSLAAVVGALIRDDHVDPLDAVVGVFPGGARNDFARTFGLHVRPEAAATLVSSDRIMRVDVGVADVTARDGTMQRVVVLNDAVIGLGATVVRRGGAGSRLRALLAWWSTVATYRPRHTDIDMVFAEWHDRVVQLRLSNGQFGLDGLHVAPLALPDDGAWDVQCWTGSRSLPFTLQPRMVQGDHLPHDDIRQWRHKKIEVSSEPASLVAVDDRIVGTTPARFEMLHQVLRLKV